MKRVFKTGAITLYTCVILIIATGFAAYALVQGMMLSKKLSALLNPLED